ncbi:acyl-CoA dehydrogenase family protein [Paenibacillus macquariensis]|uniref:Acyl-CoA dehydrogenase n=1 Tax=Paenibacillus macquariensis TaxID=948756 RepID=A0ABY1KB38_9BACL|nr:acyl-CoA dehydrogenase family protein [Paenibacillus macquariensis]MEC0089548.1 acyl-CoA/acyl-ACP dehydrogenase [Paenibacillus macquariensis]OAB25782.1 acyl-CoA dehydrogenase [Paenibacillus macquariensis subsp. macquariensis]SIR53548.1 Acyl-CoA dehydrogenase [Paenibacillus macquariensis]
MIQPYSSDHCIRNEREAGIALLADQLAIKFAERASKHDRDGSFPFDNFVDLRDSRYLKLTVPKKYGGEELSLYEMLLAQERIARGDGSTALAVGWHMALILSLRYTNRWSEDLFSRFSAEVVKDGAIINHFASELATGSPTRGGKPQTTAAKVVGGWSISGRKTYSTLSPIVEHFTISAGIEGNDEVGEFFVRKGPGFSLVETWDTLGMRATGSHDVILDNVFVPDEEVISLSGLEKQRQVTDDGSGSLMHIPACYIGIAYAARSFAIDFAKNYKPNSLPGPIADLPRIQQQIGEMEADLITARTLLYSIADRWDRDPDGRVALKPDLGLAKYIATNHALRIVDKAMRIVGATSLSRNLPLERMYRDVRAGLHNPPMDDVVLQNLAKRAIQE